jgi:hypothetical protein
MTPGPVDDGELDMEDGFLDDDAINRSVGEGMVATELDHCPPSKHKRGKEQQNFLEG